MTPWAPVGANDVTVLNYKTFGADQRNFGAQKESNYEWNDEDVPNVKRACQERQLFSSLTNENEFFSITVFTDWHLKCTAKHDQILVLPEWSPECSEDVEGLPRTPG